MAVIDETHDPALKSWVSSANEADTDFPIQNLPLGVFRPHGEARARLGTAIGDRILDIGTWLSGETLNGYCALSSSDRLTMRRSLSRALAKGASTSELWLQSECELLLPAAIGDYTDFYASIHHATNVGRLFRPDNPLLPNYRHVPIGYYGRASSIVVSGTPVRRPRGQLAQGHFGPTEELDYELELGAFLGPGNALGHPLPIVEAEKHLAGFCLVNDWSAREIQRWEYQPLGPFLAKNFLTTISPWVVTREALEPFRSAAAPHDEPPLPYLHSGEGAEAWDITLEAWIKTPAMREPVRLSRASSAGLYWTFAQMIAHHSSNGCSLRPGDLIASGTVSGAERESAGCLLELTSKGRHPVVLASGESRSFLNDGDKVILTGYCRRNGYARIGFGNCSGVVLPPL